MMTSVVNGRTPPPMMPVVNGRTPPPMMYVLGTTPPPQEPGKPAAQAQKPSGGSHPPMMPMVISGRTPPPFAQAGFYNGMPYQARAASCAPPTAPPRPAPRRAAHAPRRRDQVVLGVTPPPQQQPGRPAAQAQAQAPRGGSHPPMQAPPLSGTQAVIGAGEGGSPARQPLSAIFPSYGSPMFPVRTRAPPAPRARTSLLDTLQIPRPRPRPPPFPTVAPIHVPTVRSHAHAPGVLLLDGPRPPSRDPCPRRASRSPRGPRAGGVRVTRPRGGEA